MIFILMILMFFCQTAEAALYAVEREDGEVSIVNYNEGSSDSLYDVMNDLGFIGKPIRAIKETDLPDTREDRKFWKINDVPIGKKIVIDETKKQVAIDKALEKKNKKDKALQKIGLTEQELQELLYDVA